MSKHLIDLIHALSESKRQAYGRQDQSKIDMIEARIADFCQRYAFGDIDKACTILWRKSSEGTQLLAFHHPGAGTQLVKGGVEAQEDNENAARRELLEEAGIDYTAPLKKLGVLHHMLPAGPQQDGPLEHQRWHIFVGPAPEDLPETWSHEASGSPEEDGLIFDFFWQTLQDNYDNSEYHPIFIQVIHLVGQHLIPESYREQVNAESI